MLTQIVDLGATVEGQMSLNVRQNGKDYSDAIRITQGAWRVFKEARLKESPSLNDSGVRIFLAHYVSALTQGRDFSLAEVRYVIDEAEMKQRLGLDFVATWNGQVSDAKPVYNEYGGLTSWIEFSAEFRIGNDLRQLFIRVPYSVAIDLQRRTSDVDQALKETVTAFVAQNFARPGWLPARKEYVALSPSEVLSFFEQRSASEVQV